MSSLLARFFATLSIIFLSAHCWAQADNALKLISFRDDGRILLRWAPSKASDWLELNKNGYTLERYTIIRDSSRVYPPDFLRLSISLKPVPIQDWESVSLDDKYAAIAAQAIYGDSFQAQIDPSVTGMLDVLRLSKEQQMRYSFTLLAADQSFEIAQMSGLGFEDLNVHENEAYMYKLYGNYSNVASDTAYTIVTIENGAHLPKVQIFESEFGDKKVMLRWRVDYFKEVYSSYIIEKSEDSIRFQPLNDTPTITTSPGKGVSLKWMVKSDSLSINGKKFYYRIRGKTPFGIIGPASEVLSGIGISKMDLSIGIIDTDINMDGIYLTWKVKGTSRNQISKFLIHRSANAKEFYLLDSVTGGMNQYMDRKPLVANYYKIAGIDETGHQFWSLPFFVQAEDSIPPMVPIGLIGICDSTGRVELHWERNREDDLKGYRIFRSRVATTDYRQITVEAIQDTVFYDKVDLHNLSRKIYYKVLAGDNRGNISPLSREVLVRLVDIVPPVPPRITSYKLKNSAVEINWRKSSSKDVNSIRIFKTFGDSTILIKETPAYSGVTNYQDSVLSDGLVSYFLTAIDSSGNESISSNSVWLDITGMSKENEVTLSVIADRKRGVIKIWWSPGEEALAYRLYKAIEGNPISLYKVFTGNIHEFKDELLEVNTRYRYRLQMVNHEGVTLKFSNEIEIVY
jgi:uncharacterized protein